MKEFGWEITSHLRKGRLKIIDCYSGLAGEGEGAIKDPSDLTELNIRVTSIITRAKGAPVTLILDSLAPIFNGVEGKQAVMFLQTVSAKIKKTGGIFYMTGPTGAVPADSLAKIKSMVDGLIELALIRDHRKVARYLTVVKMERRKISSEAVQFEIDRRKGIVFHVSRIKGVFSSKAEKELPLLNVPVPREQKTLQPPGTGVGVLARLKDASDRFWKVPSTILADPKTIPRIGPPAKNIGAKNNHERESLGTDEHRSPPVSTQPAPTSPTNAPSQPLSQASTSVTSPRQAMGRPSTLPSTSSGNPPREAPTQSPSKGGSEETTPPKKDPRPGFPQGSVNPITSQKKSKPQEPDTSS